MDIFSLSSWSLGLVLAPLVLILGVYLLIRALKEFITSTISATYNQKQFPKTIYTSNLGPALPQAFSESLDKLGNIAKYNVLPNSNVLSSDFTHEFTSFSPEIFNVIAGQQSIYDKIHNSTSSNLMERHLKKKIGENFSSKYLFQATQADVEDFTNQIDKYISEYGVMIKPGLIKIDDGTDFLIEVLFGNACKRVFGDRLMGIPAFQKIVNGIQPLMALKSHSGFGVINGVRKRLAHANEVNIFKQLADIIKTEIDTTMSSSKSHYQTISALQMIAEHAEFSSKEDLLVNAQTLVRLLNIMVGIPPSRIVNVLVYISVSPASHLELIKEQIKIKQAFGKKISMPALEQMKYLEAFIKEALILSSPASIFHRKVSKDVTLSNGITLSQGSVASLNIFSKHNLKKHRPENKHHFNPNRHLETNPGMNDSCQDDIVWGFGSTICPFSKYAMIQIKAIIAIIIRKYHVFENAEGYGINHPGFEQICTVAPAKNELYLKRYSIDNYKYKTFKS